MKRVRYSNLIFAYAKSLFCISSGKIDIIKREAEFFLTFFKSQHSVFSYLSCPVIPFMQKKEVIFSIKEYLSESLVRFFVVICENKRFNLLIPILEKFLSLVRENENELEIILKSAETLRENDIDKLVKALNFLGKIIKVNNVVDSTIIGGLVIRYGFNVIDASLKSYLDRLVNLSKAEILNLEN